MSNYLSTYQNDFDVILNVMHAESTTAAIEVQKIDASTSEIVEYLTVVMVLTRGVKAVLHRGEGFP